MNPRILPDKESEPAGESRKPLIALATLTHCPLCGRTLHPWQKSCSCGARSLQGGEDLPADKPSGFDYGALAPWVPLAASLLILVFVVPMNPALFPGTRLLKIVLVTVIATAMLSLLAAARVEGRDWKMPDTVFARLNPVSWFGLMLAGWPVLFPAFYYVHYLHHDRGRMKFAWAASAAFAIMIACAWPRESSSGPVAALNPSPAFPVPAAPTVPPAPAEPVFRAVPLPPLPSFDGNGASGISSPPATPLSAEVDTVVPTPGNFVPSAPAALPADGASRTVAGDAAPDKNSYGLSVPRRKGEGSK